MDQPDEKIEKPKSGNGRRKLEVKTIDLEGKSALVEWTGDDGHQLRGYIPAEKIDEDGKVSKSVLGEAIPHGIPWDELPLVAGSEIDPVLFCVGMRKKGIWTVKDLERKPTTVRQVIAEITGLTGGTLHGAARQYEKGADL